MFLLHEIFSPFLFPFTDHLIENAKRSSWVGGNWKGLVFSLFSVFEINLWWRQFYFCWSCLGESNFLVREETRFPLKQSKFDKGTILFLKICISGFASPQRNHKESHPWLDRNKETTGWQLISLVFSLFSVLEINLSWRQFYFCGLTETKKRMYTSGNRTLDPTHKAVGVYQLH